MQIRGCKDANVKLIMELRKSERYGGRGRINL